MLLLSGLTAYLFAPRPLDLGAAVKAPRLERGLAGAALIGLLAFIVLVDAHHALSACAGLALVCAWVRREILYRIDWPLLGIFVLMFIVLRAVAALPLIGHALTMTMLERPLHSYLASAILSQGISNVPAAIVLAEFSRDWRALAFGVSVGGFGCVLGSLANLIALRLARRRGMWREFHILSVPFFGFALLAGALLLNFLTA
jgi:Na+/H+ antiporter NhaD/arsenite permease-like protein